MIMDQQRTKTIAEEFREAYNKEPTLKDKVIAVIVVVGIVWFVFFRGDAPTKEEKLSACGNDNSCIYDLFIVDTEVACSRSIEGLANYTHRWTNSFGEPRYSHYNVNAQGKNTITLYGSKIEFQNGFGAWKKATYSCVYDFVAQDVLQAIAL